VVLWRRSSSSSSSEESKGCGLYDEYVYSVFLLTHDQGFHSVATYFCAMGIVGL